MNHLGEGSLDGLTVHIAGEQSLDIGRLVVANDLGDLGGKTGELGVGGNEVSLAGDLGEGTHGAVLGNIRSDSALVGVATSLLGGGGETVLAEDVDGGVHIAVSLDESLLALHHRGVGHLAELLDHSGGDLSHVHSFQRELTNEMRWVLLGDSLGSRSLGGISASEICSLPEPARQASAKSSLMSWIAEMASSLQGMP